MSESIATKSGFDRAKYERLWLDADTFMRAADPCKAVDGQCLNARVGDGENFCCLGCRHIEANGCVAEKPLTCRVWICQAALNNLTDAQITEYFKLYDAVAASGFFMHRADINQVEQQFTLENNMHKTAVYVTNATKIIDDIAVARQQHDGAKIIVVTSAKHAITASRLHQNWYSDITVPGDRHEATIAGCEIYVDDAVDSMVLVALT